MTREDFVNLIFAHNGRKLTDEELALKTNILQEFIMPEKHAVEFEQALIDYFSPNTGGLDLENAPRVYVENNVSRKMIIQDVVEMLMSEIIIKKEDFTNECISERSG